MRCKICEHVIEEKDKKYMHKLKYYDSLHVPSPILQDNPKTSEEVDIANKAVAENNISLPFSMVEMEEEGLSSEEIELLTPTEIFGSSDEITLPKRMEKISAALKQYYGDDWLNIRNSQQPGLGR